MKKELFITTYKPDHNCPSIYEEYKNAIVCFDAERQFLIRVEIEIPEPDITAEGEYMPPPSPTFRKMESHGDR